MYLILDPTDKRPLVQRIASAIRNQIAAGMLLAGEPLPATRALAAQLGVSRGSVISAYDQLIAEGYLEAKVGSGTRVNPKLKQLHPTPVQQTASASKEPALIELSPSAPDTSAIINTQWRAAWREAAAQPMHTHTEFGGLPQLRQEIAQHLGHMRGMSIAPEQVLITAGARDGLNLLLHTLAGPDTTLRVGVESPGYPTLRKIPAALGHTLVEVPIDDAGVTVPAADQALDVLMITPSHQYPFGNSMSAVRRTELAAWAQKHNALLVEDDFDSELRYIGTPLPPLTNLAPAHTVLLGTFSSIISPTIACGYLVAPPALHARLVQMRSIFGQPVGMIPQLALARFLTSGALRRHVGRVRRTYSHKRDLVFQMLDDAPGVRLLPIEGGLHAVLLCEVDAREIAEYAHGHGIGVTPLVDYWAGGPAENGLVIGFGHLDLESLRQALKVIAAAVS